MYKVYLKCSYVVDSVIKLLSLLDNNMEQKLNKMRWTNIYMIMEQHMIKWDNGILTVRIVNIFNHDSTCSEWCPVKKYSIPF